MSITSRIGLLAAVITLTASAGCAVGPASAADLTANDVQKVRQSPTSLHGAIKLAEKAIAGRTFDAFSQVESGKLLYTVMVHDGSSVLEVKVDPDTAKIVAKANKGPAASFIDADGDEAIDISGMKKHIADAAKTAEASLNGTAVDAEYKADKGKTEFLVSVATETNEIQQVTVDAATGQIVGGDAAMVPADPAADTPAVGEARSMPNADTDFDGDTEDEGELERSSN